MIKSIVMNDMYDIGISANGKVQLGDDEVNIKDIPYIRYKFKEYGEKEIEFIRGNMKKFPNSVYIADVHLSDECSKVVNKLDSEFNFDTIELCIFVNMEYSGETSDRQVEMLKTIGTCSINRLVVIDRDGSINDMIVLNNIVDVVSKVTNLDDDQIAVCGSALSGAGIGRACLPAYVVRDLQVYKSDDIDVPLVPQGHEEHGGTCGCTHFYTVTADIKAPAVKNNSNGKSGSKEEKVPKVKKERIYSTLSDNLI